MVGQIIACREYIAAQGWVEAAGFFDRFDTHGIGAERGALRELAFADERAWDILVAVDPFCIFNDVFDALLTSDFLMGRGIAVHTARTGKLNLATNVLAALADSTRGDGD